MDIYAIFLTGLLTGGLTCMAVQGGLLPAALAQREQEGHSLLPILSFLIAKIFAYTILGFFLGLLGSFFHLSITTQVILHIAIAVFMIGTALNILQVHPLFRYFVLTPPRFLLRSIRNQTKKKDIFAPGLVGAFTIFIPCGTTQAMMALALGTGNPFSSAAVLFSFTLGTVPLFFLLGFLATRLNSIFEFAFMKVAAFAIIILAVFNFNNAVSLSGSKFTLQYVWRDFACTALSVCPTDVLAQAANQPVQEATINFTPDGYFPQLITVPKSSQVKINLVNSQADGCLQAFTIPRLNIQKIVRQGTTDTISFQAPDTPQDIRFTCSMGMYDGIIRVVES